MASELSGDFDPEVKKGILEQRRCILLAVARASSADNAALRYILNKEYLVIVKSWLDDILNNTVGGVDMLLHLLDSVADLPVTKEMVATSKLGKAVVAIEKHKICTGSHESDLKERISNVKERWSASVKLMKQNAETSSDGIEVSQEQRVDSKRSSESHLDDKLFAKRTKTESEASPDAALGNEGVAKDGVVENEDASSKKDKHIKWADKAGDNLIVYYDREGTGGEEGHAVASEGIKIDTAREHLGNERNAFFDNGMQWKQPVALPQHPDVSPVQLISNEVAKQVTRIATVPVASYASDADVPNNPTPLSDIEQALEMASQAAANPATIPFFAPQQEKEVLPAPIPPVPAPQQQGMVSSNLGVVAPSYVTPVPPPPAPAYGTPLQGASLEVVQALGLPLFLVGSNVQALQTLAATPNLLNTFRDASGIYDQARILNLVNTLTQNLASTQSSTQNLQSTLNQPYMGRVQQQYPATNSNLQGMAGGYLQSPPPPPPAQQASSFVVPPQSSAYGRSPQAPSCRQHGNKGGYRGDQNGEANLHLSGYGPSTTEAEILALFSPYVQVTEIVPKSGFSFVNTRDPDGARHAREALNGALLGGKPVRINIATRKAPDVDRKAASLNRISRPETTPLPRNALGQIDYERVRDDRGNPATKNLFVAGYGAGTTDQQLRDLFGQHATVTGTVMKGTFAFVNTTDKMTAVHARDALAGATLNGGILRINFAKESGRLGTSFDNTYGPASQRSYRNLVR